MIREAGDRLAVEGAMTLPQASALLAAGAGAMAKDPAVIDLAAVSEVDSSAIAVVFAWMREAERQGKRFQIVNPPRDMLSLAAVYGVSDLLPLA